ncbi:MAG: histidine phosphatase family protein [Candidatus Nanopelagicaceae bacterium]
MRPHKPAVIYLVRHGHSSANAKSILAGRDFKVSLSSQGVNQAESLATELAEKQFSALYSSPLPRCLETLAPLRAIQRKLPIQILEGVIEMEYGDWSGKKLATLARNKLWRNIQERPSLVRFPNGESFVEMQNRALESVRSVAKPGKTILICSHGDVIKAIVAGFLGLHLDGFQKLAIDPASISVIEIHGDSAYVKLINGTSHLKIKDLPKTKSRRLSLGGGDGSESK